MNMKLKLLSGVAAALLTLGSTGAIAASNSHYDTSYELTASGCPQGDIAAGDQGPEAQALTLAEARAFASFVNSNGAKAVVLTDSDQLPPADFFDYVNYEPPQLEGVEIALDARDVRRHGSASTEIVGRATSLAVNNLARGGWGGVVKVEGAEAQRTWILQRVQSNLACGEIVEVTEHDAERPSLTIRRREIASGDSVGGETIVQVGASDGAHDGLGSIVSTNSVVHFSDMAGAQ